MNLRVDSPVVAGTGVATVHNALAKRIVGYGVRLIDPRIALAASLFPVVDSDSPIVHTHPELGAFLPKNSMAVITIHGYSLDREWQQYCSTSQSLYYRAVLRRTYRSALRQARFVVAVSDFTAGLVARDLSLGREIHVIKNGIDVSVFTPSNLNEKSSQDRLKILYVGKDRRQKGAHFLEEVAKALLPKVDLTWVGGDVSARSSGRLMALGKVAYNDIPQIYRDSDIFFLPSLREGLSMSLLEAMASGLPVVTTRCSSMPEVIRHGFGGFLYDPDKPSEAIRYLELLISSRELRAQMGGYNRERVVADFDVNRMAGEYQDVFRELARVG